MSWTKPATQEPKQVTKAAAVFGLNGVASELVERLKSGAHSARGTKAPETVRAMRKQMLGFERWCAPSGLVCLPAGSNTVVEYVDHLAAIPGRKAGGIRQAVWAISAMHRLGDLPDPTKAEIVRQALQRMARALGDRPKQAAPFTASLVERVMERPCTRPIDKRDRALLLVMRDLLARRSEAVALDMADVSFDPDGSGIATIGRSKTDQTGQGVDLYLTPPAVAQLRQWTTAAKIDDGPIFRSIGKSGRLGGRLQASEVPRIIRQLAERAGVPAEKVARLSGHSCRVGQAQDLVAGGADVLDLMGAGRWKSPAMPGRYTSKIDAKRGIVAQQYNRRAAVGRD